MALSNEIRWNLCARRCERIYETSPDKGFSFGPREVLFSDNWPCEQAWLFSFGATYVVAFGTLEDALEDAAALLKPGFFHAPDFDVAMDDLGLKGSYESLTEDQQDDVHNHATADLTYTESGYLASWEWTVTQVTPEDVYKFVRNGAAHG